MVDASDFENDVKYWLTKIFENQNFRNISVSIEGNNEKGDGYLGDIAYVTATVETQDGSTKIYDLVLKCSKDSQTLRETTPIKDAFYTEIFFYTTVLPFFNQFQEQKKVQVFSSVPKCYGSFTSVNKEVLVLENLKKRGFDLWPKKQPLTRKHIDMIITEYAKFHATSVAVKEENSEKFEEFTETFSDTFKRFFDSTDARHLFLSVIEEGCDVLQGEIDDEILKKWKNFENDIDYICNLRNQIRGFKVLIHGDCWNNNFMFQTEGNEEVPVKLAIIDWQLASYTSPIFDVSYFLFSCIGDQDYDDLNDILATYHKTFVDQLRSLDVQQPDSIYPFTQFLDEWKQYARFGIMLSALLMKICSTDSGEVLDIGDVVENGEDFSRAFSYKVQDIDTFKIRTRPLIEYVVRHNLI